MTDKEIRRNGYYAHEHFGILRVVASFKEGERGDRRTVYQGYKPHDNCSYQAMACEFTREASRVEWLAQTPNTDATARKPDDGIEYGCVD